MCHLKMVMALVFSMSMSVNLDHGALPAAIGELEKSLKMERVQLGALGSLVFIGIAVGSGLATIIFNRVPYKLVLLIAQAFNGISLIMLTMTTNFELMCLTRVVCGFNQTFITIYSALWCDTYAPTVASKSSWITIMMLGTAVGVVFGYIGTGVMLA